MKKLLLKYLIATASFIMLSLNMAEAQVVFTALSGNAPTIWSQGNTNLVAFGFSVFVPASTTFTPGPIHIARTNNVNGFISANLIRTTAATPSLAISAPQASYSAAINGTLDINSFPSLTGGGSGTTYYFYLVVNYLVTANTPPATIAFSLPTTAATLTQNYSSGITINNITPTTYILTGAIYWRGNTSTAWENSGNWYTYDGSNYNNANRIPNSSDVVFIGYSYTGSNYNPIISSTTTNPTVQGINFGTAFGTGTLRTLTVNASKSLIVTGTITQALTTTSNAASITSMLGGGTINCVDILVGDNSTTTSAQTLLYSNVTTLGVSNNVTVNTNGAARASFTLFDGELTVGNQIKITNTGTPTNANAGYFTINTASGTNPTLILSSATPISIASPTYGSVNFYGDTGGPTTTTYTAANPTIYTATTTGGFGTSSGSTGDNNAISLTKATYYNLVIQGSGTATIGAVNNGTLKIAGSLTTSTPTTDFTTRTTTVTTASGWTNSSTVNSTGATSFTIGGALTNSGTLTLGTGNLSIAGNYTNTGTYTQGTGTTYFNGTTQTLVDNGNGTKFNNVTFQGGGTKTMSTGTNGFSVAPLYTLNVTASSTLAIGSTSTTSPLTILSTSAGDGSIGSLTAGTITGNLNVQRYMKGGVATGLTNGRGYRLLSSPVANTTGATSSIPAYNLVPLLATTLITGPSGGGFDGSVTPSVFMYDENSPSATGVTISTSDYKGFASTTEYVPMGNGFMFYFRGNKSNPKSTGSTNPYSAPFPVAENTTLNFFGALASTTGADLNVQLPKFNTAPQTYYKTSATATVTFSTNMSYNSGTPSTKRGYNIIGNPYPSAIDLSAFWTTNGYNGGTQVVSRYMYMLTRSNTTYATSYAVYDASGNTAQTGASRYALSGQAFFAVALTSSANIVFSETMKASYPSTVPSTFSLRRDAKLLNTTQENLKTAAATIDPIERDRQIAATSPYIRLILRQTEDIYNTTDIRFIENSKTNFDQFTDAFYISASGQTNRLYSLSSDTIPCFVKYQPTLGLVKKINLGVTLGETGLYTIESPIKANFDETYRIYLIDNFKKDSLDITHNPSYSFNVDKSVPATFATDRFYLSVNRTPGTEYKLLNYIANKESTGVKLEWITEFEGKEYTFEVERSQNGGKTFISLGSVVSNGAGKYTFEDLNPVVGVNQYRLKQTNIINNNELSKIVTIGYQIDENYLRKFMVYPSTTHQDITISFGKTYSGSVSVSVSNSQGYVVKNFKTSSTDKIQSQVSDLPIGVYIVTAIDETTQKKIGTSKFIKQ